MDYIENRTFDEIQIGDSASLTRTLTMKDIQLFAVMRVRPWQRFRNRPNPIAEAEFTPKYRSVGIGKGEIL